MNPNQTYEDVFKVWSHLFNLFSLNKINRINRTHFIARFIKRKHGNSKKEFFSFLCSLNKALDKLPSDNKEYHINSSCGIVAVLKMKDQQINLITLY